MVLSVIIINTQLNILYSFHYLIIVYSNKKVLSSIIFEQNV